MGVWVKRKILCAGIAIFIVDTIFLIQFSCSPRLMEIGVKLSPVIYILFVFYFENHPISLLIKWYLEGSGDGNGCWSSGGCVMCLEEVIPEVFHHQIRLRSLCLFVPLPRRVFREPLQRDGVFSGIASILSFSRPKLFWSGGVAVGESSGLMTIHLYPAIINETYPLQHCQRGSYYTGQYICSPTMRLKKRPFTLIQDRVWKGSTKILINCYS